MGLIFQGHGPERSLVPKTTLLWAARFGLVSALNLDRLIVGRQDGREKLSLLAAPPKDVRSSVFEDPHLSRSESIREQQI
jgi:hypothetical protein